LEQLLNEEQRNTGGHFAGESHAADGNTSRSSSSSRSCIRSQRCSHEVDKGTVVEEVHISKFDCNNARGQTVEENVGLSRLQGKDSKFSSPWSTEEHPNEVTSQMSTLMTTGLGIGDPVSLLTPRSRSSSMGPRATSMGPRSTNMAALPLQTAPPREAAPAVQHIPGAVALAATATTRATVAEPPAGLAGLKVIKGGIGCGAFRTSPVVPTLGARPPANNVGDGPTLGQVPGHNRKIFTAEGEVELRKQFPATATNSAVGSNNAGRTDAGIPTSTRPLAHNVTVKCDTLSLGPPVPTTWQANDGTGCLAVERAKVSGLLRQCCGPPKPPVTINEQDIAGVVSSLEQMIGTEFSDVPEEGMAPRVLPSCHRHPALSALPSASSQRAAAICSSASRRSAAASNSLRATRHSRSAFESIAPRLTLRSSPQNPRPEPDTAAAKPLMAAIPPNGLVSV